MAAKRRHFLTQVDLVAKRGICSLCGPVHVIQPQGGAVYCNAHKSGGKKGRILHPLSNVDIRLRSADCSACKGRVLIKREMINGVQYVSCATGTKFSYRQSKGVECERCGFVPEHWCQLDVDHIDGDHSNDNSDNLRTLCANCHRMKTWQQRSHKATI